VTKNSIQFNNIIGTDGNKSCHKKVNVPCTNGIKRSLGSVDIGQFHIPYANGNGMTLPLPTLLSK